MKYIAISLTPEEMERVEAALSLLQDVDTEQGHEDEARKTRELIDRINSGEAVVGSTDA